MEQPEKMFLFPETAQLQERLALALAIGDTADRLLALGQLYNDALDNFNKFGDAAENAANWKTKLKATGWTLGAVAVTSPLVVVLPPLGLLAPVVAGLFTFQGVLDNAKKKFKAAHGDGKAMSEIMRQAREKMDADIDSADLKELAASPKKDELLKALPKLAQRFKQAVAEDSTPPPQPPGKRPFLPFTP